jgi:hypothetical protein
VQCSQGKVEPMPAVFVNPAFWPPQHPCMQDVRPDRALVAVHEVIQIIPPLYIVELTWGMVVRALFVVRARLQEVSTGTKVARNPGHDLCEISRDVF